MTRKVATAAIALAGALAFSALAFAQEYDIRLSRPAKVGEKYRFTAHGTHTEVMTVSVDGRVAQQKGNEFSVDLISLLTVIATNEGGIPISYSLAIEKFIITTGGNSKSLVASEKVLLVSLEGNRYVFTLNEAPVDVSIYQALSAVIPTHTAGLTDDDVFGTREKKKVGDQWPINRRVAAATFKEAFNITTGNDGVQGVTSLDEVVRNGDNDFLVISAVFVVDEFSMPLPEGIKIENGQFTGAFSGQFPIDQTRQPLVQSVKLVGQFTGKRPSDEKTPAIDLKGVLLRSVTREMQKAN